MNGRVGNAKDFIEKDSDDNENLPIPNDYNPDDEVMNRKSDDAKEISGHGKDLLKFRKSSGFRIMNGRWKEGVSSGKFTCFQPSGNSVVDYCLIREHYKPVVKKFSVGDLTMHSDHVPLKVELKANYLNRIYPNHEHTNCDNLDRRKNNDQERDNLKDDYKYPYIIQENSGRKIKEILNSQGIKNESEMLKLNITQGETSINDIVKTLREVCIDISDKSFKRVPFANDRSKSSRGKSNEWFDEECKEMKRQVNKKRKLFQNILKDPTKTEQRESYKRMHFDHIRVFNKLKKKKENDYWKSRKQNLSTFLSKNPEEFWNQLKIKRTGVHG